jgi:hypothetical protein
MRSVKIKVNQGKSRIIFFGQWRMRRGEGLTHQGESILAPLAVEVGGKRL